MAAARRKAGAADYTTGPWAKSDSAWCTFMDGLQSWDERRDVVDAALQCARWAHTRMWPAEHFANRKSWTHDATVAFQLSTRELSEISGVSRARVRGFFERAEEGGFITTLSPARGRGDARGAVAPVRTFNCYLVSDKEAMKSSDKSERPAKVGKSSPKARSVSESWNL